MFHRFKSKKKDINRNFPLKVLSFYTNSQSDSNKANPSRWQRLWLNSKYKPLFLSITLHTFLFSFLFLHFNPEIVPSHQIEPSIDIIKATAVSPEQITQIAKAKAESQRLLEQQRQEAIAKAEALKKQQQEAARQKAKAEKEAAEMAARLAEQKAAALKAQKLAAQKAAELKAQALAEQKAKAKKEAASTSDKSSPAVSKDETKNIKTEPQNESQKPPVKPVPKKTKPNSISDSSKALKAAQQKDLEEKMAAEKHDLTAARSQRLQSEVDKYKSLIEQAISQHWEVPSGANPDLSCELLIRVGTGGVVLNVQISRSSGDLALDNSARAAVFKASPLPVPNDTDLFNEFRELRLTVKPEALQ